MFKNFKKNYPGLYSVLEIAVAVTIALALYDTWRTYGAPAVASLFKAEENQSITEEP